MPRIFLNVKNVLNIRPVKKKTFVVTLSAGIFAKNATIITSHYSALGTQSKNAAELKNHHMSVIPARVLTPACLKKLVMSQ